MKPTPQLLGSLVVLVSAACFAAILLAQQLIGETTFVVLLTLTACCSLAIWLSPRLYELNLKEAKITLQKLEKERRRIEQLYGATDGLRLDPMKPDDDWAMRLGGGKSIATVPNIMRYVSGCMKRERERLARIFIQDHAPEDVAQAILDSSFDDRVFKWRGGGVPLDVAPMTYEEVQKLRKDTGDPPASNKDQPGATRHPEG